MQEDKKLKEVKTLVEEVYSGNFDFPGSFRFSKFLAERLGKAYEQVSDSFIAGDELPRSKLTRY